MNDKPKKTKRIEEKLRVLILNDATFEEKFSLRLSKNRLVSWGSALLVGIFLLFFLFIAFTPLKRLVPGYANIENNTYVIRMKQYVDDLEKQIDLQDKYNQSLRKLLTGQGDSVLISDEYKQLVKSPAKQASDPEDEIYSEGNRKPVISDKKKQALSSFYYIPPLKGKVNHSVDFKSGHYGIDIAGTRNAPIKSIMEGIVVFADYTTTTGYTIAVQHPNDMLSIYKHNEKLLKDIGHFVENGEAIAIIGNTGTLTDGPHLHFELWYKSTPLNPEDYILFE